MRYRADLDGVRGIAVVVVVLFHAGVAGFSGGFVGVDVFFVLSGFLITSIILPAIRDGGFSLAEFYERRIRRIVPALFVVAAVVALLSLWLSVPQRLVLFGESLAATVLFYSNLFFWSATGYFQPQADQFALLHSWSLSVEAQFYVFFPLFLWAASRVSRRHIGWFVLGLCGLSFAASVWGVYSHPTAAFYSLHTRAWEFGIGAALACFRLPVPRRGSLQLVVTVLGFALVLYPVVGFARSTPFPGWNALYPCVGTALLIWVGAAPENLLAGLLRTGPLIFLGKISYSLYLWHWPLLLFARELHLEPLGPLQLLAVLGLSFAVSVLSWRWVETPLRRRAANRSSSRLFVGTAGFAAVLAASGAFFVTEDGLPGRYGARALALSQADDGHDPTQNLCEWHTDVFEDELCRVGAKGVRPTFLLWGDSHAASLVAGLHRRAQNEGRAGVLALAVTCPPLKGVRRVRGGARARRCEAFVDWMLEAVASYPDIDRVVLAGRWAVTAEGVRYGAETGGDVLVLDDQSSGSSYAENRRVFRRGLERTLAALVAAGKQAIVVGPIPEIGHDVPPALANIERLGLDRRIEPQAEEFRARQDTVFTVLAELSARLPIRVVYPHEVLCDDRQCHVERDGQPLYRDSNHLSRIGSELVASVFDVLFE